MYVFRYVCVEVCRFVGMYVCMCVYVFRYVCMCVCMHVCIYVFIYLCMCMHMDMIRCATDTDQTNE
jgi:hypothetical protein